MAKTGVKTALLAPAALLAVCAVSGCKAGAPVDASSKVEFVMYDVSNIAREPRMAKPYALGVLHEGTRPAGDYVASCAVTDEELLGKILELAPSGSWSEGDIVLTKRELSVKHTPEFHRKLHALLNGIRARQARQLHLEGYRISDPEVGRGLATFGKKLDGEGCARLSANEAKNLIDRLAGAKGLHKLPQLVILNGDPAVMALTDEVKTYVAGYDQEGKAVTSRYRTGFVLEVVPVMSADGSDISMRLRVAHCELLRMEKKQTKHGPALTPALAERETTCVTWLRDGQSLVIRVATPWHKKPEAPASWVILTPEVLKQELPQVRILHRR